MQRINYMSFLLLEREIVFSLKNYLKCNCDSQPQLLKGRHEEDSRSFIFATEKKSTSVTHMIKSFVIIKISIISHLNQRLYNLDMGQTALIIYFNL